MAIDWNKDYYAILQVPRFASASEIKTAYRNLAKKYHPDVNPGNKQAEEKFKEITNAYDLLSDENNKTIYDSRLRNPNQYRHEEFRQQQRAQYEAYQRAQYQEYIRRQQQAQQYQQARERENASPNYDFSLWRTLFVVMILVNLLRMCTHTQIIP